MDNGLNVIMLEWKEWKENESYRLSYNSMIQIGLHKEGVFEHCVATVSLVLNNNIYRSNIILETTYD